MNDSFDKRRILIKWAVEIEKEEISLLKKGYALWEAVERATEIVSRRWRRRAINTLNVEENNHE